MKNIDEALEWMRDQNRKHLDPCPEDSFEETLQSLARPIMEEGLVDDVLPLYTDDHNRPSGLVRRSTLDQVKEELDILRNALGICLAAMKRHMCKKDFESEIEIAAKALK